MVVDSLGPLTAGCRRSPSGFTLQLEGSPVVVDSLGPLTAGWRGSPVVLENPWGLLNLVVEGPPAIIESPWGLLQLVVEVPQ